MKCYRESSATLQLDLLGVSGLKMTRNTRTVLDEIERLAQAHDGQGRTKVPIAITPRQGRELANTLRIDGRTLMFGGHPLRVVTDL
jgi:hypothetical protein